MAKESGIVATIQIDDQSGPTARDLSNDITNWSLSTPRPQMDVTGQDKTSTERLLLLADVSYDFDGVFNDAANMSHDVFKTVPSTSTARTVDVTVSNQQLACECFLTDYQLTRAVTGELTYSVPAVGDGTTDPPTWA